MARLSGKALAAIALTLIVCAPIAIGYAMASEDEEVTNWQSSENIKVNDLLLNSTQPIYTDYSGSLNNADLLLTSVVTGETVLASPAYQSVSGTSTSLPVYASTTTAIPEGSEKTAKVTADRITVGIDYPAVSGQSSYRIDDESVLTRGGLYVISPSSDYRIYATINPYGVIDIAASTHPIILIRSSDGWTVTGSGIGTHTGVDSIILTAYSDPSGSIPGNWTIKSFGWRDVALPDSSVMVLGLPRTACLTITSSSGTADIALTSPTSATLSASRTMTVSGTTYSGITAISISSQQPSTASRMTATGQYADPYQGWALPALDRQYAYWTNGQQNSAISMYARISGTGTVEVTPIDDDGAGGTAISMQRASDGTITVNGTALGKYSSLMLEITPSAVTVSGITDWPEYAQSANTLNSVTVSQSGLSDIVRVHLANLTSSSGTPSSVWRVDNCSVVSGSFPATSDYALKLGDLYPGKSYALSIDSVAVYGNRLIVGNNTVGNSGMYTVDPSTGTMTDDDVWPVTDRVPIRVRGLTIGSFLQDDGTYNAVVNDKIVATGLSAPAEIFFGGEWSLTASAAIMEQVTHTEHHWAPGVMGLSDDARHTVGLAVALCCLIGLGLYGARSGVKMLWLIMACGLGAIVLLAMM